MEFYFQFWTFELIYNKIYFIDYVDFNKMLLLNESFK